MSRALMYASTFRNSIALILVTLSHVSRVVELT